MAAPRFPLRRRTRSARVTTAVSLLAAATAAVVLTLPSGSTGWLATASVLALVLSWVAARVLWTEVLESRRTNAADRSAAAAAYRQLFAVRAAEHADFTTAMTERLAQAHLAQRELEGLVIEHETRMQQAEAILVEESEAHQETRRQVRRLEEQVAVLRVDDDSVVDLVAWDEQAQKTNQRKHRALRQA